MVKDRNKKLRTKYLYKNTRLNILLGILIFLIVSLIFYPSPFKNIIYTDVNIPTAYPTPTSIITTKAGCSKQIPKTNSLYLSTNSDNLNSKKIFYSNGDINNYYVNDDQFTSLCAGRVYTENEYSGWESGFFDKLTNPKMILMLSQPSDILSFQYFESEKIMYVSVIYYSNGFINDVYQIVDDGYQNKIIWSNVFNSDNHNRYGAGPAYVKNISTKNFLILSLSNCYACSPSREKVIVVINTQTHKEKILGFADNIRLYPNNNSLSYEKMIAYKIKCDNNYEYPPECDKNNEATHYKSDGITYTTELP
jgi:hypothetical protein